MTTPTPRAGEHGWLVDLVAALDRQRDLLGRLDELSRDTGPLIDAHDAGPLMSMIAEREQVVQSLRNDLAANIALVEAWTVGRSRISDADRRLVQHRFDDLACLRDRIADRDAADARRLTARRDSILREMATLRGASAAAGAYDAPTSCDASAPRFQDREC
jgi:hypothetical protein